ncbi:PI-actitoxin-Aeq3a-like [Castor canadensis]|uniref:PI-actitoxin-Aeq3a-like n=1 Tax=Castor canadensis TaxID=51338 RepID=A0A8B7UVB8_CASCN|nr:PI-actitoxin-Aeq3a-like [Castor canadensis]
MKTEWIPLSLWLLIFSMHLRTLSCNLIPAHLRKGLCESGHLGTYCNYPAKKGTCHLNLLRYYYNTLTFLCQPFIFSGCGGNRNNFKQKFICEHFCLPEG